MSTLTKVNGLQTTDANAGRQYLPNRVSNALAKSKNSFELCLPDGTVEKFGHEQAQFRVTARNADALKTMASLNELRIAESYLQGDIDIDGDFLQVFELRRMLADPSILVS